MTANITEVNTYADNFLQLVEFYQAKNIPFQMMISNNLPPDLAKEIKKIVAFEKKHPGHISNFRRNIAQSIAAQ